VLSDCRRARRATYLQNNRRGCLRGTREDVLNEIESWTKDFKKSSVFWLNGLAGTGKSTIAQTIAERLFADGLLGASFFCSRDFEDRSDLRSIFPTLAFQLAHKYPNFRSHLVPLLRSNPDIIDCSLYGQMERLIVEPLQSVNTPTVILIDALDECKDDEPSSAILSVLGRLAKRIPKVKFFITGRPEPRIKTGFRLPLIVDATSIFVLHDVHPSLINDDIRLFLKHELSELARRHLLDGWPTDESINLLCQRAAGLFVYAVATVKYLDKKFFFPDKQLETIVNCPDRTGYEGKTSLDPLYLWILRESFCVDDTVVYSKIRTIVGTVVLVVNPLPPSGIAELMGLETREVLAFLTALQSLLLLDEDPTQPVKPFHKSFPDFITDSSRCADTRFYISPEYLHLELVTNCLRVMNDRLEQDLLSLPIYTLNSEVVDLETRLNDRTDAALRYACKSWYKHLPKTEGDVSDIVSRLRVFLEEKFLAWLEVVSALGAMRGAVTALGQLIPWLQEVCLDLSRHSLTLTRVNQVNGNDELLDTARDCFSFVTTFFEPINVSATHIYHSALELSPLSSIVRRLYYHRRHTSFPRVVAGTMVSWHEDINIRSTGSVLYDEPFAWSPCGQFVATGYPKAVEIRDSLTSELLSTLISPDCIYALAYSPDGRTLATLSGTSLTIWDVQTGGVVKEVECGDTNRAPLVWSSDGRAIGIIPRRSGDVQVYDVDLGTMQSLGTLQLCGEPYLWAHNGAFRVVAMGFDGQCWTVHIYEARSALTKIESFRFGTFDEYYRVLSFSPATYRISASVTVHNKLHDQLRILDIRNSEILLEDDRQFFSHSFSSDGSLFAGFAHPSVRIWKYGSDHYTLWRTFSGQTIYTPRYLQFSPSSSSIMGFFPDVLKVWRLDGPSSVAHPDRDRTVSALSDCGTYVATSHRGRTTVTITNLLSEAPSQFVDTGMKVSGLALTGNVLLVTNYETETVTAWRLTGEGVLDGPPGDGRADPCSSIWTISVPKFKCSDIFIEGPTAVIKQDEDVIHSYHTGTGEALGPAQAPPTSSDNKYSLWVLMSDQHNILRLGYQNSRSKEGRPVPVSTLEERWMKDAEGRHRLWIPPAWRLRTCDCWLHNSTVLWFNYQETSAFVRL